MIKDKQYIYYKKWITPYYLQTEFYFRKNELGLPEISANDIIKYKDDIVLGGGFIESSN